MHINEESHIISKGQVQPLIYKPLRLSLVILKWLLSIIFYHDVML